MVSVIIPVYNAEKTIGRAMKSVLIQPFVNQLILVNDASTDHSLKIMSLLKNKYSSSNRGIKIELLNQQTNRGVSIARNNGMEHVSSPFMTFLDADDEYLLNRFNKDVILLMENKDIDGIYAPVQVCYECASAEKIHHDIHYEKEIIGANRDKNISLYASFLGSAGNYYLLSGLIIRTRAMKQIGLFNPAYQYCQDTDWLLRVNAYLHLRPSMVNIPLIIIWRHHENRILAPSLPAIYRYNLLWNWMPYTLTRKDFTIKQRLFFILSLMENPIKSERSMLTKIKGGLEMGIKNPRLLIWFFIG